MQNPNKKAQSDIRIKILNKLYYTLFNIPLIKKKYRNLSIFWNSIPNNVCGYIISKIFKTYNFLDLKTYANLQKNQKFILILNPQ